MSDVTPRAGIDDDHGATQVLTFDKPKSIAAQVLLDLFERYTSRKFVLVLMIQVAAIVALFTHHMAPETWLAVATLVLSSYYAAHVADKKFNGGVG